MNAAATAQADTIPSGYRDVRLAQGPVVSLVVVSAGAGSLLGSLDRLAAECGGRGVELVAVQGGDQLDAADPSALEAAFPDVRFVWTPASVPAGVLRQRGLAAAAGDIVLFADDAAAVTPGWLDERLGRWPARSALDFRGAAWPSDDLSTASNPV